LRRKGGTRAVRDDRCLRLGCGLGTPNPRPLLVGSWACPSLEALAAFPLASEATPPLCACLCYSSSAYRSAPARRSLSLCPLARRHSRGTRAPSGSICHFCHTQSPTLKVSRHPGDELSAFNALITNPSFHPARQKAQAPGGAS